MPSGIKVGSAYSTYELDISGLRRNVSEAKRLLADLQSTAQKTKLPVLGGPGGGAGGAGHAARDLEKARRQADQAFNSFKRLENEYNRVRDSEIRAARAAGDHARALHLVQTELNRTAAGTVRYNNLLSQQSRIQSQVARQSSGGGGIGGFLSGSGRLLAGAGLALGAQQMLQFGVEAARTANNLERTKATVLALSGSQQRYLQVLETARRGQQLYGGSLEETLRGLGSLVNLSNRTGASLAQLDNVSRRLALIDPLQGIEGANIALKEFLTGTGGEAALSLARRFELPKKAIAELAKEGVSAADRLQALDRLLAEQGITQDVLSARTRTTANVYDRFGATIEDVKVHLGTFATQGLAPATEGLNRLIQAALGGRKAIAELRQVLFKETPQQAERSAVAGQLDPQIQTTVESLSYRALTRVGPGRGKAEFDQARDRVMKLRDAMIDLSIASEGNATSIKKSLVLLQEGKINTYQFTAIIESMVDRQRGAIDVEDRRSAALAGVAQAQREAKDTGESVNQSIADGIIKSEQMRQRQTELMDASRMAAMGLLGAGDQALILAKKYDISAEAARALIREQQRILNPKALSDQRAGERSGGRYRSNEEAQFDADMARNRAARQREADQARRDRVFAVGKPKDQLTILQQELKKLTPGTAEHERKYTEILTLQQQIAASQVKNAKAHATEAQKRLDLEEKTADAMERQAKAALDMRLNVIEDRRKRREEEKRVRQAQRVLASPNATAEQRAAALDVLEEVPLLQQKRALEIAAQARDAGGTVIKGKLYGSVPGGGAAGVPGPIPVLPATAGLGAVPAPIGAPVPMSIMPVINLSVAFFLDSEQIAGRIEARANEGIELRIRQDYEAARSSGFGRRS